MDSKKSSGMSRDHLRQNSYRYKGVSRQYNTMIAWIFVSLQIGLYWIESSLRRLTLFKFGCLQKSWEKLQLSELPPARRSKIELFFCLTCLNQLIAVGHW